MRILTGLLAAAATVPLTATLALAAEVNLYSARHYDTDITLYDAFTEETGIKVNLIEGNSSELIERIKAEGRNSPADLLITVDAGRLFLADQEALFQPVESQVLNTRIPDNLRHPDGHWFGLSKRARVIYYNKANGRPEGLDSYEDLAGPAGQGVCIRSSSNIYNLSLLASVIDAAGADTAGKWAEGVTANMARPPQGNDTAQIKAVASGECRLALANTYYVGRLLASDDPADRQAGEAVGIIWPNQDDRGTHVNITGGGVLAHAPNKDNAVKLLEFLTRDQAQTVFAEGNNEYPVVPTVAVSGPITSFGTFKEDAISAAKLGENQAEAVKLFDRAGWQ